MSGDYYDVVQRPDVSVVRGPIDRVVPEGVVSPDGTVHELDVLVLATGYDAHAYMRPMTIRGTDGTTLDGLWKERLQSYRTVGLPGFPNMFMIMGPFVSTSHVGVQEAAEWQAEYVVQAVRKLAEPGIVSLAPSVAATEAWMAEVEAAMPGRIWTNCSSYFVGDNPIPVQFPWSRSRFRRMLRTPDFADYDVQTEADVRPVPAGG
jgi:cation diffusion facilitator CzcD-associated flavoprotein CzcO